MEDLSGLEPSESDFVSIDAFPETLRKLLEEIGRTYVPVMLANAAAVNEATKEVKAVVEDQSWVQPPFSYQAKCLHWLRIEYAKLEREDQGRVDFILKDTGCEDLLAKRLMVREF